MNIRPITSAPKAVAFAGSRILLPSKAKFKSSEISTEIKPLSSKAKFETLEKLRKLNSRRILSAKVTPEGFNKVEFKPSKRNRIELVSWARDGEAEDILVKFAARHIKSTGTIIEKSHRVDAAPSVLEHLRLIVIKFIKSSGF